ncbi:DNA repair protein RecO [Alloscardovia macacae]|uniref:DNA repair protein RecO n=1 Tax=Alloscardovia macacae TaxID=1160091 RepID=A0A1Y2SXI2_9BIFI|nr:DNA repair protein RecO [Alloscardovia macacae]OTA25862.1 DNA repair protein RecO [Alloscardovia macacae]OTA28656.1 DNA repair protein RecO [Alloscardovia macacae]
MPTYTDEGVVLRTVKLGEADRIITVLTREHGKIRAVAKGVRRTKSRFGGRLEPFSRCSFLIHTGRGELQHINQCETIAAYGADIIADYDAYVCAHVMAEAVDKLLESAHDIVTSDISAYYTLLVAALGSLSRGEHAPNVVESSFLLRMLALGGWSPRLDACVTCGRQTELSNFSVQGGGMMCDTDKLLDARPLTHESRVQLYALLKGRWDLLDGAESWTGLRPDVEEIVEEWLQYYVERPVRSLNLVKSVL